VDVGKKFHSSWKGREELSRAREFTSKDIGRKLLAQLMIARSVKRRVWASQIGWCKRRVYLAMRGEPTPPSYQAKLRMGESSAVHDFIQRLLMKGYGGRENYTVVHGPIIGKADYISPEGTVIEIKALKQIPKKIPREYKRQLKATMYAYNMGLPMKAGPNYTPGILLLIDKPKVFKSKYWSQIKQPIKATDIELTEEDTKQIEGRGNEILKAVDEGIMPDMEGESPYDEACRYCSFHHVCYKMEELSGNKKDS